MRQSVIIKTIVVMGLVALVAGCSGEVRRLQGANQELVKQRDALRDKIASLEAQLQQQQAAQGDLEAKLKRAQADVDYWKGQSEAYSSAYDKSKTLQEGISEKVMRDLARQLGAEYLPGGGLRLASDILFDSGKAELKAQAKGALDQAAQAFQSQEAMSLFLRVDGHTDSQPIRASSWKDNMQLSQARARAVWLELKTKGVAPERMYTAGFGEYRPIADNGTTAGRQSNRRVEILGGSRAGQRRSRFGGSHRC